CPVAATTVSFQPASSSRAGPLRPSLCSCGLRKNFVTSGLPPSAPAVLGVLYGRGGPYPMMHLPSGEAPAYALPYATRSKGIRSMTWNCTRWMWIGWLSLLKSMMSHTSVEPSCGNSVWWLPATSVAPAIRVFPSGLSPENLLLFSSSSRMGSVVDLGG